MKVKITGDKLIIEGGDLLEVEIEDSDVEIHGADIGTISATRATVILTNCVVSNIKDPPPEKAVKEG
ncbi:MAG: hypothetical protein ACXABY_01280 [Candidatus Thorarchaeota archaeon]|jgi:hypothetical protein